MQYVNKIHSQLNSVVFSSGCTNWYINEFGRNAASWPGLASAFWRKAYFPRFQDYNMVTVSRFWYLNTLKRWVRAVVASSRTVVLSGVLVVVLVKMRTSIGGSWSHVRQQLRSLIAH
jgi:hypothetical protein